MAVRRRFRAPWKIRPPSHALRFDHWLQSSRRCSPRGPQPAPWSSPSWS